MKIVIVAEDAALVREVVEKQKHAVMAETPDIGFLPDLIVRHTPHFAFIEKKTETMRVVENLEKLFPTVRFVVMGFERGTTWTQTVRRALKQGKIVRQWSPKAPERRQIIFDLSFYSLSSRTKLQRNSVKNRSAEEVETEVRRLTWMLRCSKKTHHKASLHAEASAALNDYEWQETMYRLVHGSFKGPAWARDQLGKSLGYLAYYIPSTDTDGLPLPVTEPANLRFLHYSVPPETLYALFAISLFGCNLDLAKELYRAIHWQFEGQSNDELTRSCIEMIGVATAIHHIALAHATVIGWLLNPNTVLQLDAPRPRVLHRAIQTFADWWGFQGTMVDHWKLGSILYDLHANAAENPFPEGLTIPNFAEFLEALKASDETKPHNN